MVARIPQSQEGIQSLLIPQDHPCTTPMPPVPLALAPWVEEWEQGKVYPVPCVLNSPAYSRCLGGLTPYPCLHRDSPAASTGFLRSPLELVALEGFAELACRGWGQEARQLSPTLGQASWV